MTTVQSLERALSILNQLANYPDGLSVTEISKKMNLAKSTTHRLLSTLGNMNYVIKDEENDRYRLGFQILFLSSSLLKNINIIHVSKPFLERLSQDVNETIHLCIEDQGEVVYIDKIEGNQMIRMYSRIGSRNPMYCTGVGKVLLSGMDKDHINQIISNTTFIAKTAKTITTKEKLYEEIEKVKYQQYALDNVENEIGIRCIAAPIYDFRGKIIASFSISGPSNRITMERVNEELISKVKEFTQLISEQLGFQSKHR